MSEEESLLRHNPLPVMICNAAMKAGLLEVKSKEQNRKYALVAHPRYTKPDRVSIFRAIMKAYSPNIEIGTRNKLCNVSISPSKFKLVSSGLCIGKKSII